MKFEISVKTSAQKEARKVPPKTLLKLKQALDKLAENPRPHGAKRLQGTKEEIYRIRVGDYRVLYEIKENQLVIIVIRIAHRKNVYKKI